MSTTLCRVVVSGISSPAAETVIATTPVLAIGAAAQSGMQPGGASSQGPVRISGTIDVTEGTSGVSYTVRCRQGTTVSGTEVGAALVDTLAAAASGLAGFSFEDSTNYLAQAGGGQYVITVQETSATVAGTVVQLEMEVEI